MVTFVRVNPHKRKGRPIRSYVRKHLFNRGTISNKKRFPEITHTVSIRSNDGFFAGRKRVEGFGDTTGITREQKGRILGRLKKDTRPYTTRRR